MTKIILTFLIGAFLVSSVVGLIIFLSILAYRKNKAEWDNSSYAKQTHREYGQVNKWDGSRGENILYTHLRHLEGKGYKLLFNLYLPLINGGTTELDVVVIGPYGIIVIESKDYGGWIFGSERNEKWTVTYRNGRYEPIKKQFYNPVKQNVAHINVLDSVLEDDIPDNTPIYSIIAFSDRCELKQIDVSNKVAVTYFSRVSDIALAMLNKKVGVVLNVDNIYHTLYPYTQVQEDVKKQHIADVIRQT